MASWTEERVERLKTLWAEGLSCSRIAAELGGVSRNAVIGKVHRLGLPGRAKSSSPASVPPRKRAAIAAARAASMRPKSFAAPTPAFEAEPAPPAVEIKPVPVAQRCSLMELTEDTCRFPFGDPREADFHFCGGMAEVNKPYCSFHLGLAYQPLDRRRWGGS